MRTFLREVERTMQPMLDSIGEGVLVADEEGKPVFWNSTAERILGADALRPPEGPWIERAGVFAEDGTTHLPGKDRPLPRAIRGELVNNQEFVLRSSDGEPHLLSCTARALRDPTDRIIGGVAVFREITHSRNSEVAIRKSERLYRTIASQLPSSVLLLFDRNLRFILAGGGGLAAAGLKPDQIEGRPLEAYATPSILDSYKAVFDGVSSDAEIQRKDRAYRVQLVPVRDESEHIFAGLMLAQDVTEEKLRKEREGRDAQVRLLGEAIPQIVWTANPDGNLDYYNHKWFDYTGMTLEQTQGWGWQPVLHPDDLKNCVERWSEAVRSGNSYEVEYRFKRASDGIYRWHLGRALPVRDSTGAIVKWFGTCTDIDDQRRAQDALVDIQKQLEQRVAERTTELAASRETAISSEGNFRAAAEGMKDAFYIYDAVRDGDRVIDLRLVEANSKGLSSLGSRDQQVLGRRYSELHSTGPTRELLDQLGLVVSTGHPYEVEYETLDPNRTAKLLHLRAVALANGVAITSSDVTELRRAQRERELHTAVVRNMSEGLCLVRASDNGIVYSNHKFDSMFSYRAAEVQGQSATSVNNATHEALFEVVPPAFVSQIRERGEASYEIQKLRKDGKVITCRATASLLRDAIHGDVFVVVHEDITDKKRLEEERDGFFSMSLDMLCVAGFDGYFKQLNPAWQSTMGWSLDEMREKPWLDFVHPDDQAATIAEGKRLTDGQTTIWFENRYRCKDGSYRLLQWRAVPSQAQGVIFCTARDATDLREAQDALNTSLAENRAALLEKEVLLREIHHRVKNNLQVISSMLKLHGELISDPFAKGAFQDSQERVRAIALLHEKLYQSKDLGSVSLEEYGNSLVQTLMRTYGAVAPARVVIQAPGVSLPIDMAVPCGLILNELVTNSLKHAFSKGVRPPEIRVVMIDEGEHLTLVVSDNGSGFAADLDLTKSQTLGMHLVRTLARQLRAEVTVTSDQGTAWSLRFPRHQEGPG